MPRERAVSEVKEPHLLSIKVLRLSRPSLTEQHIIPVISSIPEFNEAAQSSRAYPSHPADNPFILSQLLTLQSPFGNIFIGETFSCCFSTNNETSSTVTDVRITAEMRSPSGTMHLDLAGGDAATDLDGAESVQRIVSYDLKEEGNYVLAVTVAYAIPQHEGLERVRTFQKLYQFVAQQCIMVRTKAGALPGGRAILEAQLENLTEAPVSLLRVTMKSGRDWRSLNWKEGGKDLPPLKSRDVVQVAFLLEPVQKVAEEKEKYLEAGVEKDGIGQLSIEWRTSCGDRGFLRTGRLAVLV